MPLGKSSYEQAALQLKTIHVNIGIVGSQTQASILTYCKNIGDTLVYHEDDSRTVTAVDAGIGFALTDLDNDAPPAVLGMLIPVGNAAELVGVEMVTNSIKNYSMSAPATALGTVTFKGAAQAVATNPSHDSGALQGVTASSNLAFIFELTSLNIDEDNSTIENNSCWLRVVYRPSQPGY